jgi:hypothetical protein
VFIAADEMQDIQRMAQEAVELHFDGEDWKLPKPSSPEQWLVMSDFKMGSGC